MHVALACRWYPPHTGFGGVAMHNYYLARALVRGGHQVTVVAARWSTDVPAVEVADGVTVHRVLSLHRPWLHRLPVLGRHARSLTQRAYSHRVAGLLRTLESSDPPDVVEFADVEAEGYFYLRRRRRRPVVIRCHTPAFVLHQYYQAAERPWATGIEAREKWAITHADTLTAPSADMARTIAAGCGLPEARVAVIPNALDCDPFLDAAKDGHRNRAGDECLILHVGRLDRGKGIDVLADAVPQVLAAVPNARFVFVGEDRPDGQGRTWRSRLGEKFRGRCLESRVTFTGAVDQEELYRWYGRAHVAVAPSLIYESFSYTCAQAAAAGVPVVASRIGGIPDTIPDGVAGLITEPGRAAEVAGAITRLARDPALRQRLGAAGQERAVGLFAAHRVADRMLDLYARAVAQGRAVALAGGVRGRY